MQTGSGYEEEAEGLHETTKSDCQKGGRFFIWGKRISRDLARGNKGKQTKNLSYSPCDTKNSYDLEEKCLIRKYAWRHRPEGIWNR